LAQPQAAKSQDINDLVGLLEAELHWPQDRISDVLQQFLLGPREHYLVPPAGFERTDLYPWRFNRALSCIRRPLYLRHNTDGSRHVIWGVRAMSRCLTYMNLLVADGRLKAQSDEMRTLLGKIRHYSGGHFNAVVASDIQQLGYLVRSGLEITSRDGNPLGDVDVLAADVPSRRIWAIETKDFVMARTPIEHQNDEEKLSEGVKKHLARIEWLTGNLETVLKKLGIDASDENWKIASLIVVSGSMLTPFLRQLPLEVVPRNFLSERLRRTEPTRVARPARNKASRRRRR
jgi:hypothetical protein